MTGPVHLPWEPVDDPTRLLPVHEPVSSMSDLFGMLRSITHGPPPPRPLFPLPEGPPLFGPLSNLAECARERFERHHADIVRRLFRTNTAAQFTVAEAAWTPPLTLAALNDAIAKVNQAGSTIRSDLFHHRVIAAVRPKDEPIRPLTIVELNNAIRAVDGSYRRPAAIRMHPDTIATFTVETEERTPDNPALRVFGIPVRTDPSLPPGTFKIEPADQDTP